MYDNMKPVWTEHHDKIVEEYEKRKREGTLKKIRIWSKDVA